MKIVYPFENLNFTCYPEVEGWGCLLRSSSRKVPHALLDFSSVAVGTKADPVVHVVISSPGFRNAMIQFQIHLSNGFRITVRISASSALAVPQAGPHFFV